MAKIPGLSQFTAYVVELRYFIGIVVALFLLSAAIGYMLPEASPDTAQALLSGLQDKADTLIDQPPLAMLIGIFWNNALGSLLALIFGLAAGIFPVFFMAANGMIIGIVLEMMVAKLGAIGVLVFIAGILPHGIFELPAVFLSAAIGLRLGYEALRSIIRRKDHVSGELVKGLLIFAFWIVPMLFVAAVIETFVTSLLLGFIV
jgi:stage II sporulation protein M